MAKGNKKIKSKTPKTKVKKQTKKTAKKKGTASKKAAKAKVKKKKRSPISTKSVTSKRVITSKKRSKVKSLPAKKVQSVTMPHTIGSKSMISESQRTENLRRFLLNLRDKILQEAKAEISKYIKGETKQIVETALDDGDWSVVDLTEDISLKQLSTHRENLLKIDEALRKLDAGTYGICEECGEEIAEERLRILPFAIYCRECQERKEILEKIEKEYE